MSSQQCPKCHQPATDLYPVDGGLREKLAQAGVGDAIPASICKNCFTQMHAAASGNSVLMNQARMKDSKRQTLWTQRMSLIKKARQCMGQKLFGEAAAHYEKYIRSMEVVFDSKPGTLTPEKFKESARHQELTVVAGVYWDLFCIYDTSSEYHAKQEQAGKMLAKFLRFTPIFPDILRKAERFERSAKNRQAVRSFLDEVTSARPRCFIATSAFESPMAEEVWQLRAFREWVLKEIPLGRKFVRWYYRNSPATATFLDKHPVLKPAVRAALRLLLRFLAPFI